MSNIDDDMISMRVVDTFATIDEVAARMVQHDLDREIAAKLTTAVAEHSEPFARDHKDHGWMERRNIPQHGGVCTEFKYELRCRCGAKETITVKLS